MATAAHEGAHQRLEMIQERLRDQGRVRIGQLAAVLGVSEMTIRRDLDELEVLGVARRVRGGAVAVGPEPFAARHHRNARAKGRIAAKLRGIVPDRGTIALDASSTVYRLAAELDGASDLVVVSNGLDTFHSLDGKAGITAILTGGTREPRSESLVGPVASRSAEDFLFDLFICSAAALDPVAGASETSLAEAEVKRAIAANSNRVVLAVDHSKLGTRAQARTFRLHSINLIVADLDPDDRRLAPYREAGIDVL